MPGYLSLVMNICVIPARGGSKRIPRKNIRDFCGKPMITWAIDHAKRCGLFDTVIVSTDDPQIADVSRNSGADVPFLRPAFLSDDFTPTVPVIAHAVQHCVTLGLDVENVCCLYPCVPFLEVADLVAALEAMRQHNAHFSYPVTEYVHPIQRAMRRLETGQMQFLDSEHELTRTQDLENLYHDAGQFYWGKASAWLASLKMHTDGVGIVIPNWRVVDIDNLDDWRRAELLYRAFSTKVEHYINYVMFAPSRVLMLTEI